MSFSVYKRALARVSHLVAVFSTLMLSGCLHITGLEADNEFSCGRAQGFPCQSMQTVDTLTRGDSPSTSAQATSANEAPQGQAIVTLDEAPLVSEETPNSHPTPHRIPEVVAQLWIARWSDDDGNLHDGHMMYVRVTDSHWSMAVDTRTMDPGIIALGVTNADNESHVDAPAKPLEPTSPVMGQGAQNAILERRKAQPQRK